MDWTKHSQYHSSGNKNYHFHNGQSYNNHPNSQHHGNNKTYSHHSNIRANSVKRYQGTSDTYAKPTNRHQSYKEDSTQKYQSNRASDTYTKPTNRYQSYKEDSTQKYQSNRASDTYTKSTNRHQSYKEDSIKKYQSHYNDDSNDDLKKKFSQSTTSCYKQMNKYQSSKDYSNKKYQNHYDDDSNDDYKKIFSQSTTHCHNPTNRSQSVKTSSYANRIYRANDNASPSTYNNYKATSNFSNQNFGKSYYKSSKGNNNYYNDDDDDDDGIYRPQVQPKLRKAPSKPAKAIDLTTQEGRKEVADETVKILKTGKYTYTNSYGKSEVVDIGTKIYNCKYSSETYRPEKYEHFQLPPKGSMCKIEVKPESTFGAARRLCAMKLKTCVLNFASATKPGGGFKNGKKAQEESLSRQSALYASLEKEKEMYQVHLANKYDNVYKDYMIYSRDVPVFRDDKTEQLLPEDQVFCTDVITSAAPWKAKIVEAGGDLSNLDTIISKRCEKILRCAIDNKIEALVLGAYGCGVFGNKPKDVSQIFKKLLIDKEYGKYFKVVEFAITGKTSENFTEFSSTFRNYMS